MRYILAFFLLPVGFAAYPQQPANSNTPALTSGQVHSLSLLGELWGFLKYYHPVVAKGTQDWDSVLLQKIPLYLAASGRDDINRLTVAWLGEVGVPGECRKCDNKVPDSLKFNLDLSWINETNFSKEVTGKLFFIRDNRNQGGNRFVSLQGYRSLKVDEKPYDGPAFQYPAAGYRLLLLFRYWNIVNYYSPYKYICGRDWKEVLLEKIPAFYAAPDTLAYQLEYVKLVDCLNDGHTYFSITPVLRSFFGRNHFAPFNYKYIEGQLVVSKLYNDSLAALIRMRPGDVLVEVNGENVRAKMKRLMGYLPVSNDSIRPLLFGTLFLFTGPDSSFVVKKIRAGHEIIDTFVMPHYAAPKAGMERPWHLLEGNIGYVKMGDLKKTQVEIMMRELEGTHGIIFDMRSYPQDTWPMLVNYLSSKPFTMARTSCPNLDYPGVFAFFKEPLFGRKNNHPYAGRVVILADETTVSAGEYTVMGLQAATKTMTIGSTTAGQDGDITQLITLPGNLPTRFSSLGIYYPDGAIAQRKGVRIDKTVIPTIHGLQEGRDEVLEAGIDYIKLNWFF